MAIFFSQVNKACFLVRRIKFKVCNTNGWKLSNSNSDFSRQGKIKSMENFLT